MWLWAPPLLLLRVTAAANSLGLKGLLGKYTCGIIQRGIKMSPL